MSSRGILWLLGIAWLTLLVSQTGCGINANLTEDQQDRDLSSKMAWVDKVVRIAERHDLAYRVDIETTGRPSIGESVDLYLDTGLKARVTFFGNSGSAPDDPPAEVVPPVEEVPDEEPEETVTPPDDPPADTPVETLSDE